MTDEMTMVASSHTACIIFRNIILNVLTDPYDYPEMQLQVAECILTRAALNSPGTHMHTHAGTDCCSTIITQLLF